MSVIAIEAPKVVGLAAKLARVMAGVARIKKSGFNDHHKYAYATEADVSDEVRDLLAGEGVAFLPTMDSIEEFALETKYGKSRIVRVGFTMRFQDGATGEEVSSKWFAEAMDTQDKALNKAATAAVKYYLLKTFLISTGDEPDADADPPHEPPAPAKKPSRTMQMQQAMDGPPRPPAPKPAPKQATPAEVAGPEVLQTVLDRIAAATSVDELVTTGKWATQLGLDGRGKAEVNNVYRARRVEFDKVAKAEREPGMDVE